MVPQICDGSISLMLFSLTYRLLGSDSHKTEPLSPLPRASDQSVAFTGFHPALESQMCFSEEWETLVSLDGKLRLEEHHEFKVCLGSRVRPCLKIKREKILKLVTQFPLLLFSSLSQLLYFFRTFTTTPCHPLNYSQMGG